MKEAAKIHRGIGLRGAATGVLTTVGSYGALAIDTVSCRSDYRIASSPQDTGS